MRNGGAKVGMRAGIALVIFLLIIGAIALQDETSRFFWIKAIHVIAVISWMAGLLYMPRLFIYHLDKDVGSDASETFKVMEDRLMRIIMNPAAVIAWAMGLWLAWDAYHFHGAWLHAKITFVVLLTAVHIIFMKTVRRFGDDERPKTPRYWRLMNEVPTVLMILIVIFVIVKPFS